MDFSAISLRIKTLGDQQAVAALENVDRKAQQTAQRVNDIFDNTLYKGSLRDAERDYDKLVNAWKNGSDQAAVAVKNVSTNIAGLGSRLQTIAVTGSVMGSTLAEGGAYGVTRFARTIANLGFVINPVVGGITILAASVGEALFMAFEKSRKEAEKFRKSLTDLINAGNMAELGKQKYDVEVGTAAEDYQDGLIALEAKLADVKRKYAEFHLGGEAAQMMEIQAKIDALHAKSDELDRAMKQAMTSSAYYDRMNEAGNRAAAANDRYDLRALTGDFGSGQDMLAAIQAAAKAAVRRWDEFGKMTVAAMKKNNDEIIRTYDELNKKLAEHIKAVTAKENPLKAAQEELVRQMDGALATVKRVISDGMARAIEESLHDGIMAGLRGGGLSKAFEALTKTMLAGVGGMLVSLGEVYLEYGGIMAALAKFLPNPFTAGTAGLAIGAALIAMGSALEAVGSGGGGGGGRGYSSSSYGGATTVITTGIVDPVSPRAAAAVPTMHPRPAVHNHNIIIGPADPVAQRMFDELMRRSLQRGSIRGA